MDHELEGWLRGSMQKTIQQVLEEEVFFGRAKSAADLCVPERTADEDS